MLKNLEKRDLRIGTPKKVRPSGRQWIDVLQNFRPPVRDCDLIWQRGGLETFGLCR